MSAASTINDALSQALEMVELGTDQVRIVREALKTSRTIWPLNTGGP